MKRCPQCGREYPEEYQFCQQDAATLVIVAASALPGPKPSGSVEIPQRSMAVWLVVGLVLVGVVGGWQVLAHRGSAPLSPIVNGEGSQAPLTSPAALPGGNAPGSSGRSEADPETPGEKLARDYAHAKASEWSLYTNAELGVQIEYPAGWTVEVTRYPDRVRVQFRGGPDVSAGLDVSPSDYRSLTEWDQKHPGQWIWGDLETGFLKRKGVRYHRDRIGSYNLGDQIATSWEFTLQAEGKPTVRKWDVGTICNRKGYALICEAPDGQFSEEYPKFDHMITTMKFHD